MAIPTPQKTYQFNVNNAVLTGATPVNQQKTRLRALKNKLIGFGQAPWAMGYSCNGTVAGSAGDGVDHWAADSDVVWATAEGTAHSWVVLAQTGVGAGFQICIACVTSGNGDGLTVRMSPSAGFTGGTTTATPTAADQVTLALGTDVTVASGTYKGWNPLPANGVVDVMNVMQSTDGAVTRVLWYANSAAPALWCLELASSPVSGWPAPSVVGLVKSTGNNTADFPTYANLVALTTDSQRKHHALGASAMNLVWTTEGCGGQTIGQRQTVANDLDGNYPVTPMGYESETTANRGRHGLAIDTWAVSTTNGPGDTYPADASRQFVVHGNFLHPWNGVIAQVA
jgi:hypothetical protein